MTDKAPVEPIRDPLERLIQLVSEARVHRERVHKLFEQLDPQKNPGQCIAVIMQEMTDTQLSLMEEFAEVVSDTFDFDRAYIEEVVLPALPDEDDEDDEEEEDGSILTEDDAAEYTALLSNHRGMLTSALAAEGLDDATKEGLEAWLARADKAIAYTADITEEPEEPEPEAETVQ